MTYKDTNMTVRDKTLLEEKDNKTVRHFRKINRQLNLTTKKILGDKETSTF